MKIGAADAKIAVIGAALRVPGADNIPAFWTNLLNRKVILKKTCPDEGDRRFSRGRLSLPDEKTLDELGVSKTEKRLIDPQFLLMLETARNALVDGLGLEWRGTAIGIFMAAGVPQKSAGFSEQSPAEEFARSYLQSVDCLATYISYKLDLRGPSFSIQSACSSSLLAVHEACKSLLLGECEIALVGGVNYKDTEYYRFQEGMIFSDVGLCNPFSRYADGTVESDGVGAIVIASQKATARLGLTPYCYIVGSAANNDGARKAAFTAPSLEGELEVYSLASKSAGINPSSVSLIEAHGTGTLLGDATELESLDRFYGNAASNTIWVGSVKADLGHLYQAAGIVSTIKIALCLNHRYIAPGYNGDVNDTIIPSFSALKPAIGTEWTSETRRRGAVTSLGIGGTNAHLVLEESDAPEAKKLWGNQSENFAPRDKVAMFIRRLSDQIEPQIAICEPTALICSERVLAAVPADKFARIQIFNGLADPNRNMNSACESVGAAGRVINAALCDYDDHLSFEDTINQFQKSLMSVALTTHPVNLLIVTAAAEWYSEMPLVMSCKLHACVGLALALELENPNVSVQVINLTDPNDEAIIRCISQLADTSYDRKFISLVGETAHSVNYERLPLNSDANMIANKVILVTGASGYLGREIIRYYEAKNTIVSFTRSGGLQYPNLAVDLRDETQVERALMHVYEQERRIDLIIHAAAFTDRRKYPLVSDITQRNIYDILSAKVNGLRYLCKYAPAAGVNKIIALSSLASTLAGTHFGLYSAANRYVDALSSQSSFVQALALDTVDGMGKAPHITAQQVCAAIDEMVTNDWRNVFITNGGEARLTGQRNHAQILARVPHISEIHAHVFSIVGSITNVAPLLGDEDLSALGIDSLSTLDLMDSIKRQCGITLRLSQVASCRTVSDLADACILASGQTSN